MPAPVISLTATMPEMRAAANRFVKDWAGERRERAEKDSFWNEFFAIFGVSRRRVGAVFEYVAKRYSTGNTGFVDLLWPKYIGVEHKSAGNDLAAAMDQLVDYLPSVADIDLPRMLVVCDFERFLVRDIDKGTEWSFALEELPKHLEEFAFLAGHARRDAPADEEEANLAATALLATLHDHLASFNYPPHATRVLLVRLLYVLFADDTGVWPRRLFDDYITVNTSPDGRDLGTRLNDLFEVLDTRPEDRLNNLDPNLAEFPYVNGHVFSERLRSWSGNAAMRKALLDACAFEWSRISPVIFGSLFQNVMTPADRRHLGAHFTSERDIMRAIRPLFLDELEAELEKAKTATDRRRKRLADFHDKLASLTFLDPAAGVGNFLLLTFRELRRLERETLVALREADRRLGAGDMVLDIEHLVKVTPAQFYGIEIEEFPARIGETAMHLVDHIANLELGTALGAYFVRLPIAETASFKVADALTTDWASVAPKVSYILSNPPFVGIKMRSADQTAALQAVWGSDYHGTLDLVTGWYRKAADYLASSPSTRIVLVSTNSIAQGEQVAPLWAPLLAAGIAIDFAHRTFSWVSEAKGAAKVHVVIIGFSLGGRAGKRRLFEYPSTSADPTEVAVTNINPYLAEGPSVVVTARTRPLAPQLPEIAYGNKPSDGGHLIVEAGAVDEFRTDPVASRYLRRYIGAEELLHDTPRWCLWLVDLEPGDLGKSRLLTERVRAVEAMRAASKAASTRDYGRPALFMQLAQPTDRYLGIPIHVSETREYYLAGYYEPDVIASNANFIAPDPKGIAFAVISSRMFITWQRTVGGRLESRLRFNKFLTWNTFPLRTLTDAEQTSLSAAGQAVLDARSRFPGKSLAELYEPGGIPTALHDAHRALDRVVDKLIGGKSRVANDDDRLRVLFERYEQMVTDGQLVVEERRPRRQRAGATTA